MNHVWSNAPQPEEAWQYVQAYPIWKGTAVPSPRPMNKAKAQSQRKVLRFTHGHVYMFLFFNYNTWSKQNKSLTRKCCQARKASWYQLDLTDWATIRSWWIRIRVLSQNGAFRGHPKNGTMIILNIWFPWFQSWRTSIVQILTAQNIRAFLIFFLSSQAHGASTRVLLGAPAIHPAWLLPAAAPTPSFGVAKRFLSLPRITALWRYQSVCLKIRCPPPSIWVNYNHSLGKLWPFTSLNKTHLEMISLTV